MNENKNSAPQRPKSCIVGLKKSSIDVLTMGNNYCANNHNYHYSIICDHHFLNEQRQVNTFFKPRTNLATH